jgi:hypothetical protein
MSSGSIYVVVETYRDDDCDGRQAQARPIAAFLEEAHADRFVASKQSEEYLYLDWEVIQVPLG